MQDTSSFSRVLLLPELCSFLAEYLDLADLASCALLSRSLHAVWNAHLWSVIRPPPSARRDSQFPIDFERRGSLVRTLELRHFHHPRAMESARVHCHHLDSLQVQFVELRVLGFEWNVFLKHFLGLTPEVLRDVQQSSSIAGGHFNPGRDSLPLEYDQEGFSRYRHFLPLQTQSPNGFLSNSIRSLKIRVPNCFTETLLLWLTRAALEGHLQGLSVLTLDSVPAYTGSDVESVSIEVSSFFQFLDSFPQLDELHALHLHITADKTVGRSNPRIRATGRNSSGMRLRKLTCSSLGVASTVLDGATLQSSVLRRLTRLTDLTLQERSITSFALALEALETTDGLMGDLVTPIRTFVIRKYFPTSYILQCWRNIVSSARFCLETLDLSRRGELPSDILDYVADSRSISVIRNVQLANEDGSGRSRIDCRSIQRFLRLASSLESFSCRMMDNQVPGFFSAEEALLWPCRDRIQSFQFDGVDLGQSSEVCARFRLWLWEFKSLTSVTVNGTGATMDVIVDLLVDTQPYLGLPLREVKLPNIVTTQKLTLQNTKDLCERVWPKLECLEAKVTFENDAMEWMTIWRPVLAEQYHTDLLYEQLFY